MARECAPLKILPPSSFLRALSLWRRRVSSVQGGLIEWHSSLRIMKLHLAVHANLSESSAVGVISLSFSLALLLHYIYFINYHPAAGIIGSPCQPARKLKINSICAPTHILWMSPSVFAQARGVADDSVCALIGMEVWTRTKRVMGGCKHSGVCPYISAQSREIYLFTLLCTADTCQLGVLIDTYMRQYRFNKKGNLGKWMKYYDVDIWTKIIFPA